MYMYYPFINLFIQLCVKYHTRHWKCKDILSWSQGSMSSEANKYIKIKFF